MRPLVENAAKRGEYGPTGQQVARDSIVPTEFLEEPSQLPAFRIGQFLLEVRPLEGEANLIQTMASRCVLQRRHELCVLGWQETVAQMEHEAAILTPAALSADPSVIIFAHRLRRLD